MGVKYRVTYCNEKGDNLRLDISVRDYSGTIHNIEGTGDIFRLKYNNDKGDKSGYFRTSEAEINIYEDDLFSIDELKTSDETEIKVEYHINDVLHWSGFVLPDFFQTEISSDRVISMIAVDRIGALKDYVLSEDYGSVNFVRLVSDCLVNTGLQLDINIVCDFMVTGAGSNFNAFRDIQVKKNRLFDDKGRSISCYDILKSILVQFNCVLVQRLGQWWIVNKYQLEKGTGRRYVYDYDGSNESFGTFNINPVKFDKVDVGGIRTLEPVASEVGVFMEYGGSPNYPENFNFRNYTINLFYGWWSQNGFLQGRNDKRVISYNNNGTATVDSSYEVDMMLKSSNNGFMPHPPGLPNPPTPNMVNAPFVESDWVKVVTNDPERIVIKADVTAIVKNHSGFFGMLIVDTGLSNDRKYWVYSQSEGAFIHIGNNLGNIKPRDQYDGVFSVGVKDDDLDVNEVMSASFSISEPFVRKEASEDIDFDNMRVRLRLYGGVQSKPTKKYTGIDIFVTSASISFESAYQQAKGGLFRITQGVNFTKKQDIDTAIFGDHITNGINGYFYPYIPDDTSIIRYNGNSSLKWTSPDDESEDYLLLHSSRQRARMFSDAVNQYSITIENPLIDPLAIYELDCENERYVFLSGSIDFLRSSVKLELAQVSVKNRVRKEYVYSYFGEGDDSIKSVSGISGSGASGGGGGGGVQDLQSVTERGNETTLPLISRGTVNKEFLGIPLSAPQQEDIVNGQGYAWLGSGVSAENPSNKLVSLDDVSITNPLDGQAVVWDASIGKFVAGSSGTSSTLDDVAKNGNITSVKLVGSTVFTLSNDGDYVQREHLHSSGWSLQLDGTKVHLRDFDGFSISEIDISGLLTGDLSVSVDDTDPNNPELVFKQGGVEVGRVPASALLAGVVRSGVMQNGVLIFRDNTNATVFSIDINSIASNSTITLNANGSLAGGGAFTLNQDSNKTIGFDLSSSAKSDIAKGVEAHGWGDFREFGLGVKNAENLDDITDDIESGFYAANNITENNPLPYSSVIYANYIQSGRYNALFMGSTQDRIIHRRHRDGVTSDVELYHSGNLRSNSENDSRYVRLTTDQVIKGIKEFEDQLVIPTTPPANPINGSIWLGDGITAENI